MEKGDMLSYDVPCGWMEAYQRGVTLTIFGGKYGNKLTFFGGHQCIISSMHGCRKIICYLIMSLCKLCGLLLCDSSHICKKCWLCLCIPLHSWWWFGTLNGLLPNVCPWCGLEAYRRGVIVTNYFWWKLEMT